MEPTARTAEGEVFDVAVDLRRASSTFCKWHGVRLSSENKRQFLVLAGFAHGFIVISETAIFHYKCTEYYSPKHEMCIRWNDDTIGVDWLVQHIGQSEANLRSVIQTAEAVAPCVLWIDEIEKGLAGSKSSGATDGGTSARVFGSFVSWMQEKQAPVFIVATANDVSQLPPEMLRKGRWDEILFVDLPNQAEREAIWQIQIAKYGRDPKDFDLVQLARASDGLTGSEIENVFIEALYIAFDEEKEPTDLTIAQVLTEFVPLSKLMAEQISGLRNWSKGRARLATSQQAERKLRRLAA